MNADKITELKQRLLEDLERLTQQLEDLGKKDTNRPGHTEVEYPESGSNSEDDNAAEVTQYADSLSLEARLSSELKDTQDALKALDNGKYGICKYCGKEIDEKRLEARPASSSCINCKKILTQEM
ncbi:MAG: TraR/DksA C4-type zinc finger protein [Patescibacteria group bacterium]